MSATFPGAIAAGDLIVVSVAWNGSQLPTVRDNINSTDYIYAGPEPGASQQFGTWYYTAVAGGSSFIVTVTSNGCAILGNDDRCLHFYIWLFGYS